MLSERSASSVTCFNTREHPQIPVQHAGKALVRALERVPIPAAHTPLPILGNGLRATGSIADLQTMATMDLSKTSLSTSRAQPRSGKLPDWHRIKVAEGLE
jgi:hypothetical protein